MKRRNTTTRSLALLAAWLLYACGNTPAAPKPGSDRSVSTEADAMATVEPGSEGDASVVPAEGLLVDPLGRWALDPGEATTDHDAWIARAILELTDDRKERQP